MHKEFANRNPSHCRCVLHSQIFVGKFIETNGAVSHGQWSLAAAVEGHSALHPGLSHGTMLTGWKAHTSIAIYPPAIPAALIQPQCCPLSTIACLIPFTATTGQIVNSDKVSLLLNNPVALVPRATLVMMNPLKQVDAGKHTNCYCSPGSSRHGKSLLQTVCNKGSKAVLGFRNQTLNSVRLHFASLPKYLAFLSHGQDAWSLLFFGFLLCFATLP